MTGGEGEGENCHPLITSLLNEGAVIKTEQFSISSSLVVILISMKHGEKLKNSQHPINIVLRRRDVSCHVNTVSVSINMTHDMTRYASHHYSFTTRHDVEHQHPV